MQPTASCRLRLRRDRFQDASLFASGRFPCPCRISLAPTLFLATFVVAFRPLVSRVQRIAAFLALQPSLKSLFVDRQSENPRRAKQFSKRLHYLSRAGEDNFVDGFRLALGSVGIEINPLSIRTEDKHLFLWQHIGRRHACLRNQIRTALAS